VSHCRRARYRYLDSVGASYAHIAPLPSDLQTALAKALRDRGAKLILVDLDDRQFVALEPRDRPQWREFLQSSISSCPATRCRDAVSRRRDARRLEAHERGLIALAAIFFARGSPYLTAVVALLFGAATALSVTLPQVTGLVPQLLQMIPYVITVLALWRSAVYRPALGTNTELGVST
jgi:hypothetical protein